MMRLRWILLENVADGQIMTSRMNTVGRHYRLWVNAGGLMFDHLSPIAAISQSSILITTSTVVENLLNCVKQ